MRHGLSGCSHRPWAFDLSDSLGAESIDHARNCEEGRDARLLRMGTTLSVFADGTGSELLAAIVSH